MNWYSQLKQMFQTQPRAVTRTGIAADCALQHLVEIFRISGGDILMETLFGEMKGPSDAAGQTWELGHTPVAGARAIIAAASANIVTLAAIGHYCTWSGVVGAAMIVAPTNALDIGFGGVGAVLAGTSGATNVLCPGDMDFTTAAFNDATALVDWTLIYRPLTSLSVVTVL